MIAAECHDCGAEFDADAGAYCPSCGSLNMSYDLDDDFDEPAR